MRAKDHGTNGPYKKIAIPTTKDRLMNEDDQSEWLSRTKNHLMNIYGGRFWFSLNVNGYTTLGERERTQCAEAAREN